MTYVVRMHALKEVYWQGCPFSRPFSEDGWVTYKMLGKNFLYVIC